MEMRVKDDDGAGSKITYDKLPITNDNCQTSN